MLTPEDRETLGRSYPQRVAFIAHALAPRERSTTLIKARMAEQGIPWPAAQGEVAAFPWLRFPVVAAGRHAWVDFSILPIFGADFYRAAVQGRAYPWVERAMLSAIDDARREGAALTIGWGALTKNATEHGAAFWRAHPDLRRCERLRSTHGDAGTVALTVQAMRLALGQTRPRIAVIGASGAVGASIARQLPHLNPAGIVLVGRADRPGADRNRRRLRALAAKLPGDVALHQDMHTACLAHDARVVVVATHGTEPLNPPDVPEGALVFDITAPPACRPGVEWGRRGITVLRAGCGRFEDEAALPNGLGTIAGRTVWDIGSGGHGVLWGCAGETIARAHFRRPGHLCGPAVPDEEIAWVQGAFERLRFGPQPPTMFGTMLTWEQVRDRAQGRMSAG